MPDHPMISRYSPAFSEMQGPHPDPSLISSQSLLIALCTGQNSSDNVLADLLFYYYESGFGLHIIPYY